MLVNKPLVFLSIILFLSFHLHAQVSEVNDQKDFILSGQVIDSKTSQPIPLAEIFISGTTKGCISDQNGYFNLKVPFFPCTLVADHVSYDSFITALDGSKNNLEILLKSTVVSIDEIKVTGKSNRKRNLRFFYSHFIIKHKNKIEILNDSVLYFKSDKKEFIAYTNEPLIIINKILGYKTKLTIKKFQVTRAKYPNGPRLKLKSPSGSDYLQILGVYYYEDLKTNSLQEMLTYKKNRRLRYFGSERHFLKSVYQGNSKQQGFQLEIFPKNQNLKGIRKIENFDLGFGGKNFFFDCDSIKVTYRFGKGRYPYNYSLQDQTSSPSSEVSTIYRSNAFFTLRENGTTPDVNMIVVGPMTSVKNLANSLPMDYDPFQ